MKKIKEIKLDEREIARIIAEKYNVNPMNGVVVLVESKIENYNSVNARRVYYPVAHIWVESED